MKRVCLSIPKNNTCRDAFNITEELQFFKNELADEFNRLTQAFFVEETSLKSYVLATDASTGKIFSYVSSFREKIEYFWKESRAKMLIIKQLTEIKTTVNSTSTLVICNGNSVHKTIVTTNG